MAQKKINYSFANDGLGDPLRQAFVKSDDNFDELYANKVDKVTGKSLTDVNFSAVDKAKLDSIDPSVSSQSDFAINDPLNPAFIKNKPTLLSQFDNNLDFVEDVTTAGVFGRSAGTWTTINFAWIKSNESLSLAQRKGDVLYGILDQYTGEEITLSKVTGTPTVDGIIFFQLGGEFFKRDFLHIRPEWFGAKGDNATDDTAALILTMSASIGEIVQLTPKKIYLVSGAINTTGLTLLGYGATIKIKNSATVNFNGVLVATNGCVIKGVTIDLNKANTTNPASQILGNGIYMNPPSWTNFIAEDVTIINGWQFGFFLSGQGGSPFNNNAPDVNSKLTNCKVYNCDVNNFHIKHVRNITLDGCVSEGSDLGFYFTDAGEISVINSQANNTLSSGYSVTYSLNCSIENSTFKNNGTNGIQIGGGDPSKTQNQNTKVLGNTVHNSTLIGITVDPTVDGIPFTPISSPCLVSGNTVSNSGLEAINLENASNVYVIGNSVRDTALNRSGIRSTNGKYNVISNNIIINCGDYGIAFFGVGGNGAGYSTILGNRVEGSDISEYTVQLANLSNMYGDFLGGEKMQIAGITLSDTPTTSAGSYDFLTRNSSTGIFEKVLSSTIATTSFVTNADSGNVKLTGVQTITGVKTINLANNGNPAFTAINTGTGAAAGASFESNNDYGIVTVGVVGANIRNNGTGSIIATFRDVNNNEKARVNLDGTMQGANATAFNHFVTKGQTLYANQTITANKTVVIGDFVNNNELILSVNTTSGNITVTLPTFTALQGYKLTVKKMDSSANSVLIQSVGGVNIDGASTLVVSGQYSKTTIGANLSQYIIL
jgi:hypothetical protein